MNLSRNVLTAMIVIAVLACVGLLPSGAQADPTRASQPPTPPAGWTDGYVMANGIRLHYWRTGGDKPVLLMAHGSSDNGLSTERNEIYEAERGACSISNAY